jgi:hypothetical protein
MTETEQSDEKIVAVASEVPASTEPTAVPAAAAEGEKPLSKSALKKLAKGKGVSLNCIVCVCLERERERERETEQVTNSILLYRK